MCYHIDANSRGQTKPARWSRPSIRCRSAAGTNRHPTVAVPRFDFMAGRDSAELPHDPQKPCLLIRHQKEFDARSENRPAPRMIEPLRSPLVCASRSRLPNGNARDERAFQLQLPAATWFGTHRLPAAQEFPARVSGRWVGVVKTVCASQPVNNAHSTNRESSN